MAATRRAHPREVAETGIVPFGGWKIAAFRTGAGSAYILACVGVNVFPDMDESVEMVGAGAV